MAPLFRPRANSLVVVFLVGILALVVAASVAAYVVYRSPYQTDADYAPEQPVPFSHQHHVGGLGLDCLYCHTEAGTSDFAGLPPTRTCMTCHSQVWTNAEMLAPVRDSLTRREPIEWTRVHELPDHAYFSHRQHVNNGVGCESCHGRVDQMRMTRQSEPLTMQWCLDCHRDPSSELRPSDAITTMGYSPGSDTPTGHELIDQYDIQLDRLMECSACHR